MAEHEVALQAVRDEGARAMLDALIATGAVHLDVVHQAVRPGEPVGMEVLDRELASRGLRRG